MNPYVEELTASRQGSGDERRVVCIRDCVQKGTDVYGSMTTYCPLGYSYPDTI
jgi:hypothetical protein